MSYSKDFERKLDKLFLKRTHWLRTVLGSKKPGKPPRFNRTELEKGIKELQQIASKALSGKLAKEEFEKHSRKYKSWHVKGHGRDQKRKQFDRWFSQNLPSNIGCVYSFWGSHNKCIYVGKTGSGGSRPSSHFRSYWFGWATRIKIFPITASSQIPKVECLAIHYFRPTINKNRAATAKWAKICPLCQIHRDIRRELLNIFRFKR